jgi:nucleoside-diphosphate-sugar epimerase
VDNLRILLIGGSGFVSGTLAHTALAAGHQVWAVTRGQRTTVPGVTPIVADRRDDNALRSALEQVNGEWDLVVDCIGYEVSDAQQDIALFCERAGHLVFISTDFVYDPMHRHFPQSEETDHYLTDGYGGKKRQCEHVFLNGDTGDMGWTILRPCHIYGPGSLLGCLPNHGRDRELIAKLRRGEPLQLIGGGHFLQQPIFAADLAQTILSCAGNSSCDKQIYLTAGPDTIESRRYYEIIGEALGVKVHIEEVAINQFLAEHPDRHSFACHRIYDLSKLRNHALHVPTTPITDGLRQHVASLLG